MPSPPTLLLALPSALLCPLLVRKTKRARAVPAMPASVSSTMAQLTCWRLQQPPWLVARKTSKGCCPCGGIRAGGHKAMTSRPSVRGLSVRLPESVQRGLKGTIHFTVVGKALEGVCGLAVLKDHVLADLLWQSLSVCQFATAAILSA